MPPETDYQQLVERIERLEASYAEQAQITTKMLATLEHISKTLDDMVNGKGTVRCAEHGAQVAALEKLVERNHEEAIGFTRRVNDEFHTFMSDTDTDNEKIEGRVGILERNQSKWGGGLLVLQFVIGAGIALAVKFL